MKTFSCDYARLYGSGGLYDASLERGPVPAVTWIANVDPSYDYRRPLPAHVLSSNPETGSSLEATYREWNEQYNRGPSSDLFALENAVLYNRTLHVPVQGEWASIYETDRPFERHFKIERLSPADLNDVLKPSAADTQYLYLGTVGSENYAHWLVDDLSRARAVRELLRQSPVTIILDRYFEAIDQVRFDSLRALLGNDDRLSIVFVDKKRPVFFDRLLYVSPNSFHPFLKSPDALRDLRTRFRDRGIGPKRLFVGRKALWRNLLNQGEVIEALAPLGFEPVTIESITFEEQIALFSSADVIVGVSGASMGNTLWAPKGASLIYLAGEGFIDPFYWDLAAIAGQQYSVCFGAPWKPESPEFSSFSLAGDVISRLTRLVSEQLAVQRG